MENSYYNIFMIKSEDNIHRFGINLRKIRRQKGYTQEKLSELSGVTKRAISHYEQKARRPNIDKVKRLAESLGVSDDELLGTSKKKKKDDDISYKIMKKVRLIERLPTRDQNTIFSLINSLVEKNKLKGKI